MTAHKMNNAKICENCNLGPLSDHVLSKIYRKYCGNTCITDQFYNNTVTCIQATKYKATNMVIKYKNIMIYLLTNCGKLIQSAFLSRF